VAKRRITRAERRRLEKQATNRAARERGEEVADEDSNRKRVCRQFTQLEVLEQQMVLGREQAQAGWRLRQAWFASGPDSRLRTALYEPNRARPPKKQQPALEDPGREVARGRFERALAAIDGKLERDAVIHVVLADQPIAAWAPGPGRLNGVSPTELLRAGLGQLAAFYGLLSRPVAGGRSSSAIHGGLGPPAQPD
jgi:hypothetical protein